MLLIVEANGWISLIVCIFKGNILNKSIREKIEYVEAYRDNDNSINYQDLDVNQEEDKICMAKLQLGPPYTC